MDWPYNRPNGSSSTPESTPTPSGTPGSSDDPPGGGSSSSDSRLVGWAAENGGTTGGGSNGSPDSAPDESGADVSTASEFLSAISSSSARVVRLTADISLSGMHKVSSNKTIIGAGRGKTITGGGLTISGQKNIIIQNLSFTGWDDDAINVESNSTNIWIDHCSFSNGFDGTVDIKRGSDFITVSWNHVSNHDKSMLLGHSDDNGSQDNGHLRVTYHHNWFDGSKQRHPRVRFGNPVHVYNNYYSNITGYGVASTENAGVLVERNYFENVKDPFHRGEGDSGPGSLVARDNYLASSGEGDAGGSVSSIPYGYTPDGASSVKSTVTAGAGVGHLNL
jgi:pectate lyase